MPRKIQPVSVAILTKVEKARVAHLATLDAESRPHIVPICFAYHDKVFYSAVDRKPKRVPPGRLARLRHIRRSPQVAMLIDEYSEDLTQLWYILIRGKAELIADSAHKERVEAIRWLKAKYPQYAAGMLADDAPIIRITPEQISSWGKL